MENKKDNIEIKGQKKESSVKNIGWDSLVGLFNTDLIVKKTQKISTAAYLLTEHIKEGDPVCNRIRQCSVDILRDSYSSSYGSIHKDKNDKLIKLAQVIEEVIVLFEIMSLTKMISQNNHAIMNKELFSLKEMALVGVKALDGQVVFPKKLFGEFGVAFDDISKINSGIPPKKNSDTLARIGEGHDKGQNSNVLYHRDDKIPPGDVPPNKNKGGRRGRILKLIRKNKDLGIKDIYNSFTEVSEKTIQRELTKMVNDKVIIRKGDKRWSRYSIAE